MGAGSFVILIGFAVFMGLGLMGVFSYDKGGQLKGLALIEVTLIIAIAIWNEQETLCKILWVVAGFFAVFVLGRRLLARTKYKREVQKAQKFVSFYNDTLKVSQRTEKFREILGMTEHKSSRMGHKDAEYVYTSVSVGGITTGGVTKTGDYDYFTAEKNTGRWELWYDGHMVKQIELTDELARQANNSSLISDYVSGNTIYVVDTNAKKTLSDSDWLELNKRNRIMGTNTLLDDIDKKFPTLEKCNAIVRWLCGNVPESDERPKENLIVNQSADKEDAQPDDKEKENASREEAARLWQEEQNRQKEEALQKKAEQARIEEEKAKRDTLYMEEIKKRLPRSGKGWTASQIHFALGEPADLPYQEINSLLLRLEHDGMVTIQQRVGNTIFCIFEDEEQRKQKAEEAAKRKAFYTEKIKNILPRSGTGMTSSEVHRALGYPTDLGIPLLSGLLHDLSLKGIATEKRYNRTTYYKLRV